MACKNETVNKIYKLLDRKKAKDITVLEVRELTTLADYFVLATGSSSRQVQALCDHLEEELEKEDIRPVNKEGYRNGEWILLGYDDAIVHLFQSEIREFYDLERIWQDAPRQDMEDLRGED